MLGLKHLELGLHLCGRRKYWRNPAVAYESSYFTALSRLHMRIKSKTIFSYSPGGVFGAILLTLLCVVIVYLLLKGELKKTSVYVEITRIYGYVPNFPLPSNIREFMNNRLNLG